MSIASGTHLMDSDMGQQDLIDNQILQIQEEIKLSDEKIRLLRSRRNALQPISRLPTEILSRIFKLLVIYREKMESGSSGKWNWLTVTFVCQKWRELTLNFPTLWNDMRFLTDEDKIRAFLKRSQNADLSVIMGSGGYDRPRYCMPHGMASIFAEMERVKKLTIIGAGNTIDWLPVLDALSVSGPFPRLKTLELHAGMGVKFCTSLNPQFTEAFAQQAKLDELMLSGLTLPWNSPLLHGLSTLSLSKITSMTSMSFRPTLVEILDILEFCPKMRSLTLDNVGPRSSPTVQRHTIDMPFLGKVTISDIDFDHFLILFNTVHIPNNANWSISCRNYPFHQPKPAFTALFDRSIVHEQLVVRLDKYGLTFRLRNKSHENSNSFTLLWQGSSDPIGRIPIDDACPYVQQLLQHSLWKSATTISLNIKFSGAEDMSLMERYSWLRLFDALPDLYSLDVGFTGDYDGQFFETFVEALTNPSIPNSPQKFSPELKRLSILSADFVMINGNGTLKKLLYYLKERNLNGRRLQSLLFGKCRGLTNKDIENLRESNVADIVDYEGDENDYESGSSEDSDSD